ncbi:hypothetical protein NEIRO03_1460 [Nematocida sp. AWRm78]|nr:hypothetical protein NEIRO02_1662 [Nematocida sp. AWRm79]KAI5183993.1 hypothetical protein NEIRO03_1460 [Nematocida sp. AWRm78]
MWKRVLVGLVLCAGMLFGHAEEKQDVKQENSPCPYECNKIFDSIFTKTDIEQAKRNIDAAKGPCKHFYAWFIYTYVDLDIKAGVESLWKSLYSTCSTKNLAYLVYASKMYRKHNIIGTEAEMVNYYRPVAEEVFNGFFKKKITLFTKWKFSRLHKQGENAKIIKFIKTLKSTGSTTANENLLSLIKMGYIDAEQHIDFLKEHARKGSADAMGILGNMYYYGWGVKPSKITARHYFSEGAKKNDADCLNGLGMLYAEDGNVFESKLYLEKASAIGSQEADYNLYKLYENANKFVGEIHLMKAARHDGYLPAVYTYAEKERLKGEIKRTTVSQYKSIASYHDQVVALEKNAIQMYKEHRNAEAFYMSLLIGDLCPKTGYENAQYILKHRVIKPGLIQRLYKYISLWKGKKESDSEPAEVEIKIQDKNAKDIEEILNTQTEEETQKENDSKESKSTETKKESAKEETASDVNTEKIENTKPVSTNNNDEIKNAIKLYILLNTRLARSSDSKAAIDLGDAYFYGTGVKKDLTKAFSRYYSSSLMESAEGDYLTGWMYEMGYGVTKNYALAQTFYMQMYEREENSYLLYGVLMTRLFIKKNLSNIIAFSTVGASVIFGWMTIPQALLFINRRKSVTAANNPKQ